MATKKPSIGYEYGDSVYAHGDAGPVVLKVLASGQDGFVGETEDGEQVKVPHDRYLGHRQRVKHAYTPVDVGEDGALVEDETGQRRFIAGKLPTAPEGKPSRDSSHKFSRVHTEDRRLDDMGRLVTKALAPLPPLPDGMVLLLKAAGQPLSGRPGLSQRRITDRTGRTSNRWVRTSPDQKKVRAKGKPDETSDPRVPHKDDKPMPAALHKHGDTVSFRHGDVEGTGKIVGSGADGVTVATDDGREHLIRHDALLPDHPPEPEAAPEAKPEPANGGDTGSSEPIFDEAMVKSLPDKCAQPVKSKDELYLKAAATQDQLEEWLDKGKGVAFQLQYKAMKESPEEANLDAPGGMLFIAPLKSEKRAAEKVESDYGGDWSKLLDVVRATMAVDNVGELKKTVAALNASGMKLARKPKDRFIKPTEAGYRDILLNVVLPNGLIGELQLHVKPMLKAKKEGHKHYEVERTLQSKKGLDLSYGEHDKLMAAIDAQKRLYTAAWDEATGGAQAKKETMSKAIEPGGAGGFSYFEHDNAYFRRKDKAPFRAVDDVLHGDTWVPYTGDALAPAVFGDKVPDPLGGDVSQETSRKPKGKSVK